MRQVFKVFSRVESLLSSHYKQEELSAEGFYLSTNVRMNIVEDLIDTYVAFIYDKDIRLGLIQDLVATVWNNERSQQANLEPQTVADYVTQQTRHFGVSDQSCYFGRSLNMKREHADDEEEKSERRFVYTATTLRLMEQIAQALTRSEAALLVGETGTGKTTSVQELAKLLGKSLHVFNMNQNTDSSDLLGGFKPVDLKYLLKPLYEQFL